MPPVTFPNHGILTATLINPTGPEVWHNSLDMVWAAGIPPAPSDPVISSYITWLRGITRDDAVLQDVRLRNWTRGAQPFFSNPALWVLEVDLPCNAYSAGAFPGTPLGEPTLGEVCARLVKNNSGSALRAPSLFIRDIFFNTMITSQPGGPPVATFGSNVNPTLLDAWTLAHLGPYLQANPFPRFCNIQYSAKHSVGPFDTQIASIKFKDVAMRDLSHTAKK